MMCESDPTSVGVGINLRVVTLMGLNIITIRINKMMELLIAIKRIATKSNMMMMIYIF